MKIKDIICDIEQIKGHNYKYKDFNKFITEKFIENDYIPIYVETTDYINSVKIMICKKSPLGGLMFPTFVYIIFKENYDYIKSESFNTDFIKDFNLYVSKLKRCNFINSII